jgi:cytoskeletal protein CcmA (bactofilin family)
VVLGKEGTVQGTILTQDAVISGRLIGTLTAESRLELQATSRIEGDVNARRLHLEEGAILNGTVNMGDRRASGSQGEGSAWDDPSDRAGDSAKA